MHALATALSKLGRHDEAIEVVQRIIELEPEDAFAYTSLSIFLQRKGLIPEAEQAAAVDPGAAAALEQAQEAAAEGAARPQRFFLAGQSARSKRCTISLKVVGLSRSRRAALR